MPVQPRVTPQESTGTAPPHGRDQDRSDAQDATTVTLSKELLRARGTRACVLRCVTLHCTTQCTPYEHSCIHTCAVWCALAHVGCRRHSFPISRTVCVRARSVHGVLWSRADTLLVLEEASHSRSALTRARSGTTTPNSAAARLSTCDEVKASSSNHPFRCLAVLRI